MQAACNADCLQVYCRLFASVLQVIFRLFAGSLLIDSYWTVSILYLILFSDRMPFLLNFHVKIKMHDHWGDGQTNPHLEICGCIKILLWWMKLISLFKFESGVLCSVTFKWIYLPALRSSIVISWLIDTTISWQRTKIFTNIFTYLFWGHNFFPTIK